MSRRILLTLPMFVLLMIPTAAPAQPVAVRQMEGLVRGFLVMRDANGAIIANGDSIQTTHGHEIVNRLVFHFKDGSLQDETVVFTQNGYFHVLKDHLIQRGPSFKRAVDLSVDATSGVVTSRTVDEKGKEKVETETLKLPSDLANGIVPVVLKNLPPGQQSITESMVVASPKPLIIKLQIAAEGQDTFSAGTASHKATRYDVKIDIGGLKGDLAELFGKVPADTHVWISEGECPSYLKSEGPAAAGAPIWTTELVSPAWPHASSAERTTQRTHQRIP